MDWRVVFLSFAIISGSTALRCLVNSVSFIILLGGSLVVMEKLTFSGWLQTTQPTNGGAVTADTSCSANSDELSRPPLRGPDLPFFFWAWRSCGHAGWLTLLLTKAGDVETNPGPTTLNKRVWICYICHKQIHVRKQISIRCNRIEHWVHLRCAGIRQAQYTATWACHLHRESRLTQT